MEGVQQGRPDNEFPEGASNRPDAVSRRTMMGLMGASLALAGATACRRPEQKIVPYVNAPEGRLPGVPQEYATTMAVGAAPYGVVVESHDGRPTKIEGNELHPESLGAASPWVQASVLNLYDPDRSRKVMRREKAAAGEGGEDHDAASLGDAGPSDASHGDEGHGADGHGDSRGSGFEVATWEDFEGFWGEVAAAAAGNGGAGLAVLSESYSSPTLARLATAFRERYPAARWAIFDAVSDETALAGAEAATGQAVRPIYHLDKASVVLALDADLLGTEGGAVRHSRGFAARRRVASEKDGMNRLYAVESTVSLTGAAADHRVRLKSGEVGAFAAALAADLGVGGTAGGGSLPESARGPAAAIAKDLRQAGSTALVAAGQGQPAAVHALALAINQALGAVGTTVTLHETRDQGRVSSSDELQSFGAALADGTISTLVVLGGNPALSFPADLEFSRAVAGVANLVHLGQSLDETAHLATWHLPQSHFLEAWGDARSADGTVSVAQPLIAPLFDSRSNVEVLSLLAGSATTAGNELVRESAVTGGWGAEDRSWRKTLHDGVAEGSALPAVAAAAGSAALDLAPPSGGLEIVFTPSRSIYDGRFANNSWLQELPDPITKITWSNAALLSPKTAGELGVESGDVVSLTVGERSIEAAAWILPGQADDSVALSLGYGRKAAGRVGNDRGANAYPLRTSDAPGFAGGLSVSAVGREEELVQTQDHWSLEGRPLVREATLDEYHHHPHFAQEPDHHLKLESLWEEKPYDEGNQWGMGIDLNLCTGCNACVVACQSENNIPVVGPKQVSLGREMHWLRVDRYFNGDENEPEVVFQPVPCMHCENAPCEQVCPVAATVHDREGITAMVYNRCIGTRYCSNNCPYKVRRFNFYNFTKHTPELVKMAMNPDVTVRSRGVMEKCSYCIQRINQGKITAKREDRSLVDGDVKTACQQTCPTDAIVFGNINDEASAVAQRKAEDRDYVMLAELNNKPRTSYQAKLRNPNPEWPHQGPANPGGSHG